MPAAHPKMVLERDGALATIASDLHHILMHLRSAAYYSRAHGLGLKLPTEEQFVDLLGQCKRLHDQGEKPA